MILASMYSGTHQIVVHWSSWSGKYKVTYDGTTMVDNRGRSFGFQVIEDNQNVQYTVKISGWTVFTMKVQVTRNGVLMFSPDEKFKPPVVTTTSPSQDSPKETIIKETIVLVICPHCGQRNDASRRTCENCGASI